MGQTKTTDTDKKEQIKAKLRAKKKESKKNKRKARIIVRNIPFITIEEDLRKHFGKFGEIDEVHILKREVGQLVGCAFVQFKLKQKAAKAIHHLNGKPFLNREISCDWAKPKKQFEEKKLVDIKQEPVDVPIKEEPFEVVKIKTEIIDEEEETCKNKNNIEDEQLTREDEDAEVVEEPHEDEEETEYNQEPDQEKNESSAEEDFSDQDSEEVKEKFEEKPRQRLASNDTVEGKTIFIKNLPFSCTNKDLKESMTQFGALYYALVCMDPFTEHSKGSGFVKFVNKEDADKCLEATDLKILDLPVECCRALSKAELQQKSEKVVKQKTKDSRNLYLVKEGVILAGTKAAEDVSAADMAKRLQLEQYKTQMLRNLNMFVSRTRLVVHNIPSHWDDRKLRILISRHTDKPAAIKEARIMRNMRDVDAKGIGRSREYGFVGLATHEDAVKVLRSLNNNPDVFTKANRPIVSFSIENRSKINAREKRLLYSKLKNPKSKDYNPKFAKVKKVSESDEKKGIKRKRDDGIVEQEDQAGFSGTAAKPGVKKLRSKFNLKTQAKLHRETLKQRRKKKRLEDKKHESIKQPKQKMNKKKGKSDDNFSKLVSDYKQKLLNASNVVKKSKWYE